MMNLDFGFYSWDVISSFVLKGFYFSVILTAVAPWVASSSAPCWR